MYNPWPFEQVTVLPPLPTYIYFRAHAAKLHRLLQTKLGTRLDTSS